MQSTGESRCAAVDNDTHPRCVLLFGFQLYVDEYVIFLYNTTWLNELPVVVI